MSDWQPLVINIDDLQWADMDSARLLSYLLGPPDAPPLLFVGVYRREEATTSAFLRHVLSDSGLNTPQTEHLAVDPLSLDEARHLTRELLSGQPDIDATLTQAIAAESDGVPFFIGELARSFAKPCVALAQRARVGLPGRCDLGARRAAV